MNHLQLQQAALPDLSESQISRLPKDQLVHFSNAVQQLNDWTLQMRGRINRAMEIRYADQIRHAESLASRGWTGGYATASDETGAVFLSCEFVLLTGPFAKRKIWSNVGLHSNKGPTWAQMGRSFIKAVLNSSRNIHPDDGSPEAQRARQIRSFGDLDGAEFAARIGIEKDGQGEYRNIIRLVIEPDHKEYAELMQAKLHREGGMGGGSGGGHGSGGAPAVAVPASAAPAAQPGASYTPRPGNAQARPAWAQ